MWNQTLPTGLNNQNIRNQLNFEIKICLVKNGYPPQYSPEVFKQVMEQVENFKENDELDNSKFEDTRRHTNYWIRFQSCDGEFAKDRRKRKSL